MLTKQRKGCDSMIFKKPYGFLIKNFRIIHIIITLLTIYIAINTRNILSFFRRFISNGYSLKDTIHYSSVTSAISVTRIGARNSIPTLDEVLHYDEII